MSGRRLNPRPSAQQTGALPTELTRRLYATEPPIACALGTQLENRSVFILDPPLPKVTFTHQRTNLLLLAEKCDGTSRSDGTIQCFISSSHGRRAHQMEFKLLHWFQYLSCVQRANLANKKSRLAAELPRIHATTPLPLGAIRTTPL